MAGQGRRVPKKAREQADAAARGADAHAGAARATAAERASEDATLSPERAVADKLNAERTQWKRALSLLVQ